MAIHQPLLNQNILIPRGSSVTAPVTGKSSNVRVTALWGLVYATKPEFRAEADKDLSLRLGLNYKILRKPGQ